MVDRFYDASNEVLCSSECPCDANRTLWNEFQSEIMFTSSDGALKFDECPGAEEAIADEYYLHNSTQILQVIEEEFHCASFCAESEYFTFSKVNL